MYIYLTVYIFICNILGCACGYVYGNKYMGIYKFFFGFCCFHIYDYGLKFTNKEYFVKNDMKIYLSFVYILYNTIYI